MSNKLNFLLLATGSPSSHLTKAITERGHTHEWHNPNDLYLFVSESENGYDRIYNGSATLERPVRLKAKSYDAIVSRIGNGLEHGASILRHLSENLDIYCPQDADGLETASNKLKTTQRLSSKGLRVPLTTYASSPLHTDFLIGKVGGLPSIGKLLKGSQGIGVFMLETPQAANTTLESLYRLNASLLLQKFVESGSKDIRAIVVGDKVSVAMERTGKKDFRANISQGGSGRKVELSKEDIDICIKAAKAVNLDFAGVDILKDEQGKTYVIEVNGNPGTKIIEITGHNYFTDLVKYIEDKVDKNQKVSKAEEGNEASIASDRSSKSYWNAPWNQR
jgi:ribosomal protein S6--L-glutamate ligase